MHQLRKHLRAIGSSGCSPEDRALTYSPVPEPRVSDFSTSTMVIKLDGQPSLNDQAGLLSCCYLERREFGDRQPSSHLEDDSKSNLLTSSKHHTSHLAASPGNVENIFKISDSLRLFRSFPVRTENIGTSSHNATRQLCSTVKVMSQPHT